MFAFVGAHIARQFEFVQTQWVNDGKFFGAPSEKDPLIGPNDGSGQFSHSAMARPMIHSLSASERKSSSSVNNVTTCL